MCTAITFQTMQGENFFGRTMDFSHPIEPGVYVIPKNYEWYSLATRKKYIDNYSFISIGQETDGMLVFLMALMNVDLLLPYCTLQVMLIMIYQQVVKNILPL